MRLKPRVSGGLTALKQHAFSIISVANKASRIRLGLLLMFVGIATCSLFAATTGSISGTVRDQQGAVIPNANVVLRNTLTGVVQTITTDPAGFYNFPSLPIGHYDITFSSAGFNEYLEKDIVIDIDTARRVDATLKPAGVTESVTVTEVESTQAAVDTETAQMGEVIGTAQIEGVPLDGRNFTDLVALQPGVVPINVQWYNSVTAPNNANDGVLSIAGAQDVHSGYYVNGANTVDGAGTGTFLMPVLDSIAEFRIVTNNAGAEYGGYSGGITNVATKSGTNQFHGNAFEYLRNAGLNAAGYFDTGASTLHQNIFGGTVGGPIKRNKMFFFGDFEGLRNSDGQGIFGHVPSDAERSGDLTEETAKWGANPHTVASTGMAATLTQRLGYSVVAGEPYYSNTQSSDQSQWVVCTNTDPTDPHGCVFPTGKIPQSAWDPLAGKIMTTFLPHANTTFNNLPYYVNNSTKNTWTGNKGAARVDTNTRYGQLTGYWHYDPWTNTEPGTWGPTVPGFPSSQVGAAQLAVASLTTPVGSTAVNTFVASWTYNRNIQGPLSSSNPQSLASLGWTSAANGGPAQISVGPWQMMPVIQWENIGPSGFGGAVTTQYNNTYQGQDDFSKVIRTHTFKFGAQYHWDHVNVGKANNLSNGEFLFGSSETGLGDADYLLGALSGFYQGQPAFVNMRNFYAGIYAEDSWRATSNLTLNYGVRWEVDPWWKEAHNHVPVIRVGEQSVRFPNAPQDYVFPGDPGVPDHLANINWDNFGPRFGVAYTPDFGGNPVLRKVFGEHGQSSIRAGYGLYFTNIEGYNTWNLSAAPFGLFYSTPWHGLLSTPYVDRRTGIQQTNPFPLDYNNYNWALQVPFNKLRSPVANEASPYEEHIDFSVERELTKKTILQVAYVGTFGHHLDVVSDGNAGDPALCVYLSNPANVTDGNTCYAGGGEDSRNVYNAVNGQTYHGTREALGPNYRSMGWQLDVGNSNYHAFETTLRHTTDRATVLFAYTWSKAIDNGSGRGDQIFQNAPNFFRGISLYDVPQNLVVTYSYELPIDKFIHGNDRLTRGWKFSGTTRASNGVPIWIMDGNDMNLRGDVESAWGVSTDEPTLTPGNVMKGDHNPRHQNPWFNTTLFSEEPFGQEGNSPRRFIHGPGINNTDLAVMKDLKLKENLTMQFRAQAYNAWNHAQFNGSQVVDGAFDDGLPSNGGTFGLVGGAQDMRKGELVLKLMF